MVSSVMRAYRNDKRVDSNSYVEDGWPFPAFENPQIVQKIAFPVQTCAEVLRNSKVNMADNSSKLHILWHKFSFCRQVLSHIATKVLGKVT